MIGEKNIIGNLNNQKFLDIWLSKKFKEARKFLSSANRSLSPCNVCDVNGDLIGEKHHLAWKNYNEKNFYFRWKLRYWDRNN